MGVFAVALLAALTLVAPQESSVPPAPTDEAPAAPVVLPPPVGSVEPAPALSSEIPVLRPAAPLALPAEAPPRGGRPLEERAEAGPSVGGFLMGSVVVVGLLGGAFLLLRRFAGSSRLGAGAGAIRVLARKPLGPKQEIFLVEVGSKVFMIGSTRERLATLGEFSGPDDLARLRAELPRRREDSQHQEFSESLREGLREQEGPREERVFASIADELAEIRKTVRAWRA